MNLAILRMLHMQQLLGDKEELSVVGGKDSSKMALMWKLII